MCVNSSNFVLHSISDVKMDVAVPQPTGNERAMEVEECACPQGYRGPSCQVRKKKKKKTFFIVRMTMFVMSSFYC